MSNKLNWLHISDIHFNNKTEWRDDNYRDALCKHLAALFKDDEGLRPDFIFCTGDIAFGESSKQSIAEQFEQAKVFFDKLLIICGSAERPLPKGRLFVVPGNHDVNRQNINDDAQQMLTSWAAQASSKIEFINQRFNDRNKEFVDTIKRLDEYGHFVAQYLPHQDNGEKRHTYANVVSINGLKVGIVGFNSAWTCSGPEDDRNIWLAANWQFNQAHKLLSDADIRIGLIHHPIDWFNNADREVANRRIATDFDFWLHGHSHSAWVTPAQNHIVVAAGAVGAQSSDEFGINITSIDIGTVNGASHLHNIKSESSGWTIAPIHQHAPKGVWRFTLPTRLNDLHSKISLVTSKQEEIRSNSPESATKENFVDRYLTKRFEDSLHSFSSLPKEWVPPVLSSQSELATDAKSTPKIATDDLILNPRSVFIKAPPQYGLTSLAHFLARAAWRANPSSLWLYLDAKNLKPHNAAVEQEVSDELKLLGCAEGDIKCVILDSMSPSSKDALKLLKNLCERYKNLPIICMQQIEGASFNTADRISLDRDFETLYLWSLPKENIRKIVAAYNQLRPIGDEDIVTNRLVSDLEVLNLHRTPLNCLTLLKVSEIDFDESPVNRSEMIKRILFLLFNVDDIPTYKTRPDLKDCEYVLGHFCEQLIREGSDLFSRDQFLVHIQKCCQDRLIDLETQVVFDVLYANNVLVRRGNFFCFKFSYWIFYFAAQRMHHEESFAKFIFEEMRYAQHPEIIEFYTGIDRKREDALQILTRDIQTNYHAIKSKCGLPDNLNPYRLANWALSSETREQMQKEIENGVLESNLPTPVKDQYADRAYNQARPYDQDVRNILLGNSFVCMLKIISAGSRALRNSDYVSPDIKRQLLNSILNSWQLTSQILLVLAPILAERGHAAYDGAAFALGNTFSDIPQERLLQILVEIPSNVAAWYQDDLFSRKMGPLLIDQLMHSEIGEISRHELILLLIRQRPRDWEKQVQKYVANNPKNSFYLLDVYRTLRAQYRFSYASAQTLQEIEHLIKVVAAKHVTGDKVPGIKTINKLKFKDQIIPEREV